MNNALAKMFKTKNKLYYYLLNNKDKSNYILMKDLIIIFENDFSFLGNILEHKNDSISKLELADIYCKMIDLINKKYSDNKSIQIKKNEYFHKLDSLIYDLYNINFNKYNPSNEEEIYFEDILFKEEFSEDVACYIARNMVNKIFNLFMLEYYLHDEFKSFEELEEYGIDEFIFNILDRYDYSLSLYAYHHKKVIEDIYKRISNIRKKWDIYYLENRENKYKRLMYKLHEYMFDNNINYKLFYRLLYFTAYKSNCLEEFFFQCDDPDMEVNFNNLEELFDDCKEIDKHNDFFFLKHYHNLKKIFDEELKEEIGDEFICRKIKKR